MTYYSAEEFIKIYECIYYKVCYVCCDNDEEVKIVNNILCEYFPLDHNIIIFY
jgi:hypothetical protein